MTVLDKTSDEELETNVLDEIDAGAEEEGRAIVGRNDVRNVSEDDSIEDEAAEEEALRDTGERPKPADNEEVMMFCADERLSVVDDELSDEEASLIAAAACVAAIEIVG